jgi:hypothetical protein
MLSSAPVAAAGVLAVGVLAVAVFAAALTGPQAMAAASKCLNKANKYVLCTDKLRSATPARKKASERDKHLNVESWSLGHGNAVTPQHQLHLVAKPRGNVLRRATVPKNGR